MTKRARTVQELALDLDVLKARDARRARELKALRGDLDAIERILADDREALLRRIADQPLPAANSTPLPPHARRFRAGTALSQARYFFLRLIGR